MIFGTRVGWTQPLPDRVGSIPVWGTPMAEGSTNGDPKPIFSHEENSRGGWMYRDEIQVQNLSTYRKHKASHGSKRFVLKICWGYASA